MGKIEKQVHALLATEPDNAFTVEDLCEHVYGRVEKRHRVAVLRVVRRIAARETGPYRFLICETRGGELVLFDATNVISYATARLKADNLNGYRGKGFGHRRRPMTRAQAEAPIQARLAREDTQKLIREGGWWWRHTQEAIARMNGDVAAADRVAAEGTSAASEDLAAIHKQQNANQAAWHLLQTLSDSGLLPFEYLDAANGLLLRAERVDRETIRRRLGVKGPETTEQGE